MKTSTWMVAPVPFSILCKKKRLCRLEQSRKK